MNHLLHFLLLLIPISIQAQQIDFNLDGGYVANGYDVVAYFDGQPQKGSAKFTTEYGGAQFKFSSQQNLDTFQSAPEKYLPQYGGWCAYAMGKSGEKVSIDPETFEIRDGKLYLFYNAFFTNTFEKWKKEGAAELKANADQNWEQVQFKN